MKKLNIILCLVAVLILAAGMWLDFTASSTELEFTKVTRLDDSGNPVTTDMITTPRAARVMALVATALNAVGISILISVLVVSRVESAQRESLSQELFGSVFRRLIPEELFQVVQDDILRSSLVQRDVHWNLHYSIPEDGKVALLRTATYELHNISDIPYEKDVKFLMIQRDQGETIGLSKANWKLKGVSLASYDVDVPDESEGVLITTEGDSTTVSYKLKIPPRSHVSTAMVFRSEYDEKTNDSMFANHPIMDLRVTATFPAEMQFRLHASTSSPIECLEDGLTSASYRSAGALLPKQGIVCLLTPKPEPEPQLGEQDGADQPATAPDSKSEGSEKPQLESE